LNPIMYKNKRTAIPKSPSLKASFTQGRFGVRRYKKKLPRIFLLRQLLFLLYRFALIGDQAGFVYAVDGEELV